jgi:hypothetical protein
VGVAGRVEGVRKADQFQGCLSIIQRILEDILRRTNSLQCLHYTQSLDGMYDLRVAATESMIFGALKRPLEAGEKHALYHRRKRQYDIGRAHWDK